MQNRDLTNVSSNASKRFIDISDIKQIQQSSVIILGRVKKIFNSNQLQKLINNGPISKIQLLSKLASKQESRSGHVYVLYENMKRESDILVKTKSQHLKVGQTYLFVGMIHELNQQILFLEGVLNQVKGQAHLWDNYVDMIHTFQNNVATEIQLPQQPKLVEPIIQIIDD